LSENFLMVIGGVLAVRYLFKLAVVALFPPEVTEIEPARPAQ
jgi:hypothetical protein